MNSKLRAGEAIQAVAGQESAYSSFTDVELVGKIVGLMQTRFDSTSATIILNDIISTPEGRLEFTGGQPSNADIEERDSLIGEFVSRAARANLPEEESDG